MEMVDDILDDAEAWTAPPMGTDDQILGRGTWCVLFRVSITPAR